MDAILQGRDFPDMGVVEVVGVADDLALGITRGLHPKPYDYVDPNEDVVAVVREGPVTALVVADGHNGHEGSHSLVDALLDRLPQPLPTTLDRREAATIIHDAAEHMRAVRRMLPQPNRMTRSTLTVALVADNGGARTLTTASIGDSVVIVVDGGVATQVTRDRHRFLGDRYSLPEVAGVLHHTVGPLDPQASVVVASDGLTNFAPVDAVGARIDPAQPTTAVRSIIDLAGDGGAGDNVGVALLTATGRG